MSWLLASFGLGLLLGAVWLALRSVFREQAVPVSIPLAPATINGASGVAVTEREIAYATELWLAGPSAFWLHPEGPLSDTTPEEWRAKQESAKPKRSASDALAAANAAQYAARGLYGAYCQNAATNYHTGLLLQSQLNQLNQLQNNLGNALGTQSLARLLGY